MTQLDDRIRTKVDTKLAGVSTVSVYVGEGTYDPGTGTVVEPAPVNVNTTARVFVDRMLVDGDAIQADDWFVYVSQLEIERTGVTFKRTAKLTTNGVTGRIVNIKDYEVQTAIAAVELQCRR